MTKAVFFDTETTGLLPKFFNWNKLTTLPHVVQLAAILVDVESFEEVDSINILVQPSGFQIPESSTAIHGISHEKAEKEGVPISEAIMMFDELHKKSSFMVAHNIEYDEKIMRIEYERMGWDQSRIQKSPKRCTMMAATPVCNIPGRYGPKWPKLSECYQIFFDEELKGAHDALIDIRATMRVYQYLLKSGSFDPVT